MCSFDITTCRLHFLWKPQISKVLNKASEGVQICKATGLSGVEDKQIVEINFQDLETCGSQREV